jgi:predicted transposase YdaD
MLQVHDIRETRVYQEAKQEGMEEGMEKGAEEERQRNWQEKLCAISKMAARNMSAADIADVLGLEVDLVRQTMATKE